MNRESKRKKAEAKEGARCRLQGAGYRVQVTWCRVVWGLSYGFELLDTSSADCQSAVST